MTRGRNRTDAARWNTPCKRKPSKWSTQRRRFASTLQQASANEENSTAAPLTDAEAVRSQVLTRAADALRSAACADLPNLIVWAGHAVTADENAVRWTRLADGRCCWDQIAARAAGGARLGGARTACAGESRVASCQAAHQRGCAQQIAPMQTASAVVVQGVCWYVPAHDVRHSSKQLRNQLAPAGHAWQGKQPLGRLTRPAAHAGDWHDGPVQPLEQVH